MKRPFEPVKEKPMSTTQPPASGDGDPAILCSEQPCQGESEPEPDQQHVTTVQQPHSWWRGVSLGLSQERLLYQQHWQALSQEYEARWDHRTPPAPGWSQMQELSQMRHTFSEQQRQERQHFLLTTHLFEHRLAALRHQLHSLKEQTDPAQRLIGLRHFRATCRKLQQDLREVRRLLRERREGYSLLRQEYETARQQLHAFTSTLHHRRS